jgi:hypothetical protein
MSDVVGGEKKCSKVIELQSRRCENDSLEDDGGVESSSNESSRKSSSENPSGVR